MSDEIREAQARAERAAAPVADVLSGCIGAGASAHLSESARALLAWRQVNGDVERTHTTGVYVGASRRLGELPELTVYVDSNAYVTDFSANREVYLARMETMGLRFSRVTFRRSKYPTVSRETPAARARKGGSRPLPPIDPDDAARIDALCEDLPQTLRESVSRAMRASYRRSYDE